MELMRLNSLGHTEYVRIRRRQCRGEMKTYVDKAGYLCCDYEEFKKFKPNKRGRKPKGEMIGVEDE